MLGFLFFAASLATRPASAGGPTSVPSILVILTGGLVIALWLADSGLGIAVALRERALDAEGAGLLYGIASGLFVVSWFALGGSFSPWGSGPWFWRGLAPVAGMAGICHRRRVLRGGSTATGPILAGALTALLWVGDYDQRRSFDRPPPRSNCVERRPRWPPLSSD